MKEIIISSQKEFNAIPSDFEGVIKITGIVEKINRRFEKAEMSIYGSAQVESISGSAQVKSISGSAQVKSIYDSAQVESISGSAQVKSISGSAQVESISGSAQVKSIYGLVCIGQYSSNKKITIRGQAFLRYDTKTTKRGLIKVVGKYAVVKPVKQLDWFERNGVDKKSKIIVYKRVSNDFKTQEGTTRETLWVVGTSVEHPNWDPGKEECGAGKFHACNMPIFCNEFRSKEGDKYIAIEVSQKELYEWKGKTQYPHKIAFRKGRVLFECDVYGEKVS